MSSSGIAGLGITFLPSPPLPQGPVFYAHGRPSYAQQLERRHQTLRHTVSYDVDLNRRAWDDEHREAKGMAGYDASDSNCDGMDRNDYARRARVEEMMSPLSDYGTTTASSDPPSDYSPESTSSLPSSGQNTSPQSDYSSKPDVRYQTDRLAKSLGAPPEAQESVAVTATSSSAVRPYPPPIDFLPALELYRPVFYEPIPAETHQSLERVPLPAQPPPMPPPPRLPEFLRQRVREREQALARPQSMLDLGELHARQALLRSRVGNNVPNPPSTTGDAAHSVTSASMYRSSTSYSGKSHEADAECVVGTSDGSPESIPSSAGILQRRHLQRHQVENMDQPKARRVLPAGTREGLNNPRSDDVVSDELDAGHLRVSSATRPVSADLSRHTTLLTAGANPTRRKRELDRLLAPGKAAAKSLDPIADSPAPSSSLASGHTRSRSQASSHVASAPVVLEQAKSSKQARVELDLVLQTALVVEGGMLRGRINVRVNKPRNKTSELWLSPLKIRVIGFEELPSMDSRHIFFHHAVTIADTTTSRAAPTPLPCTTSEGDDEGFHVAVPGLHSVPFSMRLPLGKGAKGTWKSKQGVVRYIAIASIKLKGEKGTDRSIAHFYRHIDIFPFLNPAIALASAHQPSVARISKPLFLGGDGEVELTASLHRTTWVAGQHCYVDVTVKNGTSKRIKTLSLSLLRTTTIYRPRPYADLGKVDRGLDDLKAATQSTRKKVIETTLDIGKKANKGVTAIGSWMGVEPRETGEYSHSIIVPIDALSIQRGRYLDVVYALRISVGSTLSADVSVEVPVKIVNFVSLDPPPGHITAQAIPTHRGPIQGQTKYKPIQAGSRAVAPHAYHLMPRAVSPAAPRTSALADESKLPVDHVELHESHPGIRRTTSLDSVHTADLPRDFWSLESSTRHTMEPGSTVEAERRCNLAADVVTRAKDRQTKYRLSLGCASTASTPNSSHHRLGDHESPEIQSGEHVPSSVEPETWEPSNYVSSTVETHPGGLLPRSPSIGDVTGFLHYNSVQLDDLDDIPDDTTGCHIRPGEDERSDPYAAIDDESEDEIDAVLSTSPFGDDGDAIEASSARHFGRQHSFADEKNFDAGRPLPQIPSSRSSTASPVKSPLSQISPSLKPRSSMRNIERTFAFATPASPVKALDPSASTSTSVPSSSKRASRGPLPSHPILPLSPTLDPPGVSRQASSSSLKRASAIALRRTTGRSLVSEALSQSPTLTDWQDGSKEQSTLQKASIPSASRSAVVTRSSALLSSPKHSNPSPQKEASPVLRQMRSMGDLRPSPVRPGRRATVLLPSVRTKVAALETRQNALEKLAAVNTQPRAANITRAVSIASVSDGLNPLNSDMSRANSIMSFQAPLLRRKQ